MNNSYNLICVYLRSKGSHCSSLSIDFLRVLLLAIISITHLYFFSLIPVLLLVFFGIYHFTLCTFFYISPLL